MYPDDGWVLVYRDFGTASGAPSQPFFVLYNKYRGILRYMFYNAQNISYTYYRAELSFVEPQFSGALMTFSDDENAFLNDYDPNNALNFMGKVAVFDGWGYADFQLFGYDPTMDLNSRMRLQIWGIDESQIDVESTDFTLNQILDDANLEGFKDSSGDLKKSFSKGQKFYKSSEKAIKGIKERVNTEQKKINDGASEPWWFNDLSNIANSTPLSAVPLIGGVAGFVNSFFFSDDASPKPIKFQGSLELEGTISNTTLLVSDDFILNSNASTSSQYYVPLNDIRFGVFNLIEKPVLQWDSFTRGCGRFCTYDISLYVLKAPLSYVLNEASEMNLVSMKVAYAWDDREPTIYEDPVLLEGHAYFQPLEWNLPSKIALELKFKTQNKRNNSEDIVLYKTFPIDTFYEQFSLSNSYGDFTSLLSIGFNVPNDIALNDQNDYQPNTYPGWMSAKNNITAGGNFTVGGNLTDVTLVAGREITLIEGFATEPGVDFDAMASDFTSLENGRLSNSGFEIPEELISRNGDFYINIAPDRNFQSLKVDLYNQNEQIINVEEERVEQKMLSVYPNPNRGEMSIDLTQVSKGSVIIELLDVKGNVISVQQKRVEASLDSYSILFSANSLKAGLYILKVKWDDHVETEKILITN